MKWLHSLFMVFLLVLTGQSQTNVISVNVGDYGLVPKATMVTLTLISPNPRTYNNILISQVPISITTSSNGIGYFTNIIWGQYRADINANPVTKFLFVVNTNSTGAISLASLVSNPQALPPNPATNYYTQAQIDSLLSGITTSQGITNAYATNAAGIFVTNRVAFISTNYASTSITNGLATTNYVLAQGFVTASVTNGLATTNYVKAATNGLPSEIWTLGTASQSNSTAFASSSVTNLTVNQIATIAAAITNGQTGANLGYTVFTNSIWRSYFGGAVNSYGNAAFTPLNPFLGNTNYPEAQNTNMGIVFSPVIDNDGYLEATNSLGGIPRFFKFWWRYEPDVTYNRNVSGVPPNSVNLFKISKDLTDNGNDYVEAYNDLMVDRDLRVIGAAYIATNGSTYLGNLFALQNITTASNAYVGGELYVTNHAYDVSTSRLDPVANEFVTAEYVQSVMAANFDLYFSTNTSGITVTNGLGQLFIPSTMVLANPINKQTNTISSFTNGTYFTARLQTNSISYIQSIPINLYTYVQITGGGSVTAHPEMWLYNTNGTIVQLGYSSDNTYSSDISVPVNLAIAMTNTAYLNVNLTNSPQLLLRWYVTSKTGNPTWKFLIGAGNVSHITVGTIPSANQNYVGTFTGNGTGLTNIPATGIVGTAVTNNASPTFTGLAVGAQTALDVNGNGKFGGVGHTNGVLTGNGSGLTNLAITNFYFLPVKADNTSFSFNGNLFSSQIMGYYFPSNTGYSSFQWQIPDYITRGKTNLTYVFLFVATNSHTVKLRPAYTAYTNSLSGAYNAFSDVNVTLNSGFTFWTNSFALQPDSKVVLTPAMPSTVNNTNPFAVSGGFLWAN